MIKNYIFDLYGTLIDIHTDESIPALWKRMALLFSLQGAAYSAQELRKAYSATVEEQIERRAKQLPSLVKTHIEPDILAVFTALYARKGSVVSRETALDTALFFRSLSMKHIRLYPDAKEILCTLRKSGQGVYLLSNAQAAFTMPELHMLGLEPLFDGIVLSSDVGVKKPDKAIFEHLLSKYRLSPETCMMIGNDEEADMLGASSLGMAGLYIHTNQSPCRKNLLPASCREIRCLQDIF